MEKRTVVIAPGRLILLPTGISEAHPEHFLPDNSLQAAHGCRWFIAERAKTARQFLKAIAHPLPMAELQVMELNKHGDDDLEALLAPCLAGNDVALMSEAGVPAVADPGGIVVRAAHKMGIEVLPLVGASSLLLALMASGMNGQKFSFHGYLSKDEQALMTDLRQLEAESRKTNATQMFIETPYRNQRMLEMMLKVLHGTTDVGIASNLHHADQWIRTMNVTEWKSQRVNIDRKPAVFLLFAGNFHT